MRTERRWKLVALLATAMMFGMIVAGTPAGAHVGGSVSHLWKKHVKPKADERYANAVSGTDKAKNANNLDGLDSKSFAQVLARGTTPADPPNIEPNGCYLVPVNPQGVGDVSDDVILVTPGQGFDTFLRVDARRHSSDPDVFVLQICNPITLARDSAETEFSWIVLRMP